MGILAFLAGLVLILAVLLDGFETMLLPRRVAHAFRFARLFYHHTWMLWRRLSTFLPKGRRREGFLSLYGPLSLLALLAAWISALIVGFALLYWSVGGAMHTDNEPADLFTCLYLSGVTFFTLGYGDVTPREAVGRVLAIVESGGGFAFLAVIIGYVPVLYQAFSHREVTISLLDARAGSPPSAGQCLSRAVRAGSLAPLGPLLEEWERWSAELLESHLSFPVLAYYRSQHDNQSWLATLTFILDTCSIVIAGIRGPEVHQARLTFAMARHAAVDLALVFRRPPLEPAQERFSKEQWLKVRAHLEAVGITFHEEEAAKAKLAELRELYEPFVHGLGEYFAMAVPHVFRDGQPVDNWQTSAWTRRTPGLERLPPVDADNVEREPAPEADGRAQSP
jgi:hypothetical protein